ncbi:MAG TPA: LLM class F420-dependent oxidoreductase [Gammaproteobacteria bacterium]|nr:LLM class F420-dependent oxidoreductase [Gammaproteobacteria bacterium]|tara:strand:+ start:2479 stop:3387 length:909 start_codon:yes stop_codon:yes gene_type:complete
MCSATPIPPRTDELPTQFGVCLLPTDLGPNPIELAIASEERGLDMLFFAEGSHVPVKHTQNAYSSSDAVKPFARMYDSITALAACAAVTTRIKLGTGVCLLTERDPIITAKSIASLDRISKGRVIFGVAGGFIREAIENHGSSFKHRWAVVRERALAIRTLWNNDPAEFHGKYVNFDPVWSRPKPIQAGGPPIYIGSNSAQVPARVAAYADGWMPIYERYAGDPITDLKAACTKFEREFNALTLYLFGAPRDETIIEDFTERGARGFVFFLPPDATDVIRELDNIAMFIDRMRTTSSTKYPV